MDRIKENIRVLSIRQIIVATISSLSLIAKIISFIIACRITYKRIRENKQKMLYSASMAPYKIG